MMRARFGKAAVGDVVRIDAERVLDDLGGAVAVVAADCLFEKVGPGVYSSLTT
jgi:hypothetical protein